MDTVLHCILERWNVALTGNTCHASAFSISSLKGGTLDFTEPPSNGKL